MRAEYHARVWRSALCDGILWADCLYLRFNHPWRLLVSATERQLDQFDRKIIDLLVRDGRMAVTDLAEKVGLSKTPCQVRLKRLIDDGVIKGFRAVVDMARLGLEHVAFTEVKLSDTREQPLAEFNRGVLAIPEIEEAHMIAGNFDYLLKVRTADIRRFRMVLGEKISTLPHVSNTSTFVVMEPVKEQAVRS
ncbi:MAG: ArsR family transcriptional regulator [Novosphingobium sp. 16-62-11]|nr:MAG: ArsR family transcriptional regulator [Novosphingobium sp. 35-62-5]OYZ46915.1 MAG: ArsR family transcriptional regulator [Novosphingobium sp. 16-62-11]OZA21561.1 MAG: ArsR family transcriptional regulator [Novosphingobium sp. 17-62-19]